MAQEEMTFNEGWGHCPCGGHYEYAEVVKQCNSTTYIYSCDKCGHKIELSYLPD